jgi:ribosome-associated protein
MAKTARAAKVNTRSAADLLADAVVKGLQERKGREIISLDLRKLSCAVADIFVVCHGDSSTHVEGLKRSVEEQVSKDIGDSPTFIEGLNNAHWILIDYINVVVHIFQPEQRSYYGIEKLWADAATTNYPSD